MVTYFIAQLLGCQTDKGHSNLAIQSYKHAKLSYIFSFQNSETAKKE